MGRQTTIAWTSSTLNLAWGCSKVTKECTNCYMYRLSERFGKDPYTVKLTKAGSSWEAVDAAIRKMNSPMFVNSMSDTFHKDISDETLDMWFSSFANNWRKTFQILTKRPERARDYFLGQNKWGVPRQVPPNVWLGTSVGIASAKSRIDVLRSIPARIRFLSCEPLLEDLGPLNLQGIHWVIIGGESDDKAPRPMDPAWAESIVSQAKDWPSIHVFFKQLGGLGGDGAGGDLLHGRKIQEMPNYA